MLIFFIVCAALALLLAAPVTLRFRYDGSPRLRIWYLCFFYTVKWDKAGAKNPSGKRPKKAKGKPPKKSDPFRELVDKKGLTAALGDLCDTLKTLLKQAARFLTHVRIPRLSLSATVGAEDAAQAAIRCGEVCAAVYPLLGFASALMKIRPPHIDIQPDYTSPSWSAHLDLKARAALLWVLVAGISALWALIRSKVNQTKVNQTRATAPRGGKKDA